MATDDVVTKADALVRVISSANSISDIAAACQERCAAVIRKACRAYESATFDPVAPDDIHYHARTLHVEARDLLRSLGELLASVGRR